MNLITLKKIHFDLTALAAALENTGEPNDAALSNEIHDDLTSHCDVYDASKFVIRRSRGSVTQGMVYLSYLLPGGAKTAEIGFGDEIKLRGSGNTSSTVNGAQFITGWAGLDDNFWMDAGERLFHHGNSSSPWNTYAPWRNRSDKDFVAKAEEFANRALQSYRPSMANNVGKALVHLIADGYYSEELFRVHRMDFEAAMREIGRDDGAESARRMRG